MTPLLRQFLDEGRGLISDAVRDLLELEGSPDAADRTASVLRAFHTLKGSSGLFGLGPMTRLLHVAEDLVAQLRDGRLAVDSRIIDNLLSCLDQTSVWLDSLEADESLPGDADQASAALIAALRAGEAPGIPGTQPDLAAPATDPLDGFDEQDREAARALLRTAAPEAAIVAILYEPRTGCFFDGEDPLRLFRDLPGLAALHIDARAPWPPAGELDPYACILRFRALAVAPEQVVRQAFRLVPGEVRIAAAEPGPPTAEQPDLVGALLAEQIRLLDMPGCPRPEVAGRIGAAATAAANALLSVGRGDEARGLLDAGAAALAAGDPRVLAAALRQLGDARPPAPTDGPAPAGTGSAAGTDRIAGGGGRALRVEEARIDHLMRLVGEIVVAKNGLDWLIRSAGPEIGGLRTRLQTVQATMDRLTRELHGAVLQIRMLPVGHVFQRFPRLVRDLSNRLGKPVRLVLEGEDAEADKAIVEQLFEPLLHLVRNSLDHGIEPAAERRAAGKPETATVSLRASQSRGRILVEVADDGRGIDAAAVRHEAVARGILDAEAAAALTDDEAMQMIFAPGLSTAGAISDLSGRGVGMDVVRAAVEKSGGTITVRSTAGRGTTVTLALPLTLSSIRILTVEVRGRRLGVPMDVVSETLRLPRDAIRRVKGREVVALRDRVIPVVELGTLLGLPGRDRPRDDADVVMMMVDVDGRAAAVEVDGFAERLDAMLRPMEGLLSNIHGYLGTTLLGDGAVLLVLDLKEILR